MPFRDAHHVTGRIVAKASQAGGPLDQLPLAAMQAIEPRDHPRWLARALGEEFGREPDELWGHSAEKCARAGGKLAQAPAK